MAKKAEVGHMCGIYVIFIFLGFNSRYLLCEPCVALFVPVLSQLATRYRPFCITTARGAWPLAERVARLRQALTLCRSLKIVRTVVSRDWADALLICATLEQCGETSRQPMIASLSMLVLDP